MKKPKNLLQMHGFLGAVNNYQQMWPQHAHILAHLSSESYPNHNKPFHIYTDASSYWMGAYFFQYDKPAQLKYTVGDKELLSIVMVLTEFCTMLLGAVLHIHNDHLNITTDNTTPDCIICWLG